MRTTSVTVASIVTLLELLTSTALAWLIFGERFGSLGSVGAALPLRGDQAVDAQVTLLLHRHGLRAFHTCGRRAYYV